MSGWKKQAEMNKKKAKYAWGRYFQQRNALFELQREIYYKVQGQTEPSGFLMNFIKELYDKSKVAVECPICLDVIDKDNLTTTNCGHNFHECCLAQLKDTAEGNSVPCPMCRTPLYVNK